MSSFRETFKKIIFGGMAVSGLVVIAGGLASKTDPNKWEWVPWASGSTWAALLSLFLGLTAKNLQKYSIDVVACLICALLNLSALAWIFHLNPALLWTYVPTCIDIGILEIVGLKFMATMEEEEIREYGFIKAFLMAFLPRGRLP